MSVLSITYVCNCRQTHLEASLLSQNQVETWTKDRILIFFFLPNVKFQVSEFQLFMTAYKTQLLQNELVLDKKVAIQLRISGRRWMDEETDQ